MRSSTGILFTLFILGIFTSFAAAWWVDEYKSGIIWPEPTVMDAGLPGGPPADAVVLFDGKSLDGWEGGDKWKVEESVATAAGMSRCPARWRAASSSSMPSCSSREMS